MFFSDLQVETPLSVTKYTLFETVLVTVATFAADRTHCFEASQFVGRLMRRCGSNACTITVRDFALNDLNDLLSVEIPKPVYKTYETCQDLSLKGRKQ